VSAIVTARYRGEHHSYGSWQPRRPSPQAVSTPPGAHTQTEPPGAVLEPQLDPTAEAAGPLEAVNDQPSPVQPNRKGGLLLAVLLGLGVALATQHHPPATPGASREGSTPQQWARAFAALTPAAPGRVCSRLLTAPLRAGYPRAANGSCPAEVAGMMSNAPVRVGPVLYGTTAVVKLEQPAEHRNWSVVLDRGPDGWRAITLTAAHSR